MSTADKKLYCFWTGNNPLSANREKSVKSMSNSRLDVYLITHENIHEYLDTNALHPAYQYLSLVHKSDYLRCYFMHHFGGGYCDIKPVNDDWIPTVEHLNQNNNLWAAGYQEVGAYGIGNIYANGKLLQYPRLKQLGLYTQWRYLQFHYKSIIGNCAFVFKPRTPLTTAWWNELNKRMDYLHDALKKNPSKHPREGLGKLIDASPSTYPIPWSYILGDILAPTTYKYRENILKSLPPPCFSNYQ